MRRLPGGRVPQRERRELLPRLSRLHHLPGQTACALCPAGSYQRAPTDSACVQCFGRARPGVQPRPRRDGVQDATQCLGSECFTLSCTPASDSSCASCAPCRPGHYADGQCIRGSSTEGPDGWPQSRDTACPRRSLPVLRPHRQGAAGVYGVLRVQGHRDPAVHAPVGHGGTERARARGAGRPCTAGTPCRWRPARGSIRPTAAPRGSVSSAWTPRRARRPAPAARRTRKARTARGARRARAQCVCHPDTTQNAQGNCECADGRKFFGAGCLESFPTLQSDLVRVHLGRPAEHPTATGWDEELRARTAGVRLLLPGHSESSSRPQ